MLTRTIPPEQDHRHAVSFNCASLVPGTGLAGIPRVSPGPASSASLGASPASRSSPANLCISRVALYALPRPLSQHMLSLHCASHVLRIPAFTSINTRWYCTNITPALWPCICGAFRKIPTRTAAVLLFLRVRCFADVSFTAYAMECSRVNLFAFTDCHFTSVAFRLGNHPPSHTLVRAMNTSHL